MTLLPQRKKSAEEIAQLRGSLGVPATPAHQDQAEPEATMAAAPMPIEAAEAPEPTTRPKPVRSLKKSEQSRAFQRKPASTSHDSAIPARRHSNEELEDMRKRQALAMLDGAPPNPKLAKAHNAIIGLGYLCAVAGAGCFVIQGFPLYLNALCALTALAIAVFIYLQRPISRHHAGFIAVISIFISIFSTLHHFPQLQYAS